MLSDPLLLRTHRLLGFNGPLVLSSGALAVIVGPLAVVGETVVAGKRVAVDVEVGAAGRVGRRRVVDCVCVAAAELLWLTVLRRSCGCCVFCVAAAALRWLTVLCRPCGCCCCWKSVDLVVELNRPAAMCSRTGAASMMMATGAQVRLFRRGAARPVGVR